MLLAFGADINPLNKSKMTPLDVCVENSSLVERSESLEEISIQNRADPAQHLNEAGILLSECGAIFGRDIDTSCPCNSEMVTSFMKIPLDEKAMERGIDSKTGQLSVNDTWNRKLSEVHFEVKMYVESSLKDVNKSLVCEEEVLDRAAMLDKAASLGLQIRELRLLQMAGSRILFLDGGGMRGLLEIEMLSQIEKRTGRRIVELFDWIVGTSTGAVIALALVYGKEISKCLSCSAMLFLQPRYHWSN